MNVMYDTLEMLHWFNNITNVQDIKYWLFPINVGNKHWILAIVDVSKNTATMYDSACNTQNVEHERKLKHIVKLIKFYGQQTRNTIIETLDTESNPCTYEVYENFNQQTDSWNCGPYILKAMEHFIENSFDKNITIDVQKQSIESYRKSLLDLFTDMYKF
jgi:Ulp1 family protease